MNNNPNTSQDRYIQGEDILGNRMREIDADLHKEMKPSVVRSVVSKILKSENFDSLLARKTGCEQVMAGLNSEIADRDQMDMALKDISSYSSILERMDSSRADQLALQDIMDSDLKVFFGQKMIKDLEYSQRKMIKREQIKNSTKTVISNNVFVTQATADWESHQKKLQDELKAEKNKDVVDLGQVQLLKREIENRQDWINHRVTELEAIQNAKNDSAEADDETVSDRDLADLMQSQRVSDQTSDSPKVHKLVLQKEMEAQQLMGKYLSYSNENELRSIFLQARHMRMEKVREYLTKRNIGLSEKLAFLKGNSRGQISDIQSKKIEKEVSKIANAIGNQSFYTIEPSVVVAFDENISHIDSALDDIADEIEFIDEYKKSPEAVKKGLAVKVANIKYMMAQYTPERTQAILSQIEHQEKKRIQGLDGKGKKEPENQLGNSPAYRNKREFLLSVNDPQSELMQTIRETEPILQNVDTMEPEELLDYKKSLDTLQNKLLMVSGSSIDIAAGIQKPTNSELAKKVISLLKNETDSLVIEKILEDNLGKEHFELLSDQQFANYTGSDGKRRNLKEYTGAGMVIYIRGNDWKIIINKEGIKDGESLNEQITHELLHLEFENDDEIKKLWIGTFTQNSAWSSIKNKFVSAFPEKRPPTDAGWRDEDILSEIYAMQNGIARSDDERFKSLKNEIRKAGITAKMLGLPENFFNEYENPHSAEDLYQEAEIRGSEEGHGGGGGGGDSGGGEGEKNDEGGVSNYGDLKTDIKKNNTELNRLASSDFAKFLPGINEGIELMKKYNNETDELNELNKIKKSNFLASLIKDRIQKIKDDLKSIEDKFSDVSDNMPNTSLNPIRKIWNQTHFSSLEDIVQIGKDISEWWKRRRHRKIEDHAARIGSAIAANVPLPLVSEFGIEAEARELHSEEAEVGEWEKRLSDKDGWDLIHILHELADAVDPNKDMFKGILKALAKKGRINWRDPYLWRILNKLQSGTYLGESGGSHPNQDQTLLKNPILLRQKLHKALGEIWDYDFYLNIDRQNGSAISDGKKKYEGTCKKIQDQLTARMEQLFKKFMNGEKVDPHEFEEIIDYSIADGKSYAEAVMFYLIVGTAKGLLGADRPLVLDSQYVNKFPALQWIYHFRPSLTKADYLEIANRYFKNDMQNGKPGKDFNKFFWTEINNNELVLQRVRKAVKDRGWDHDWGRAIAVMGDAAVAKAFLSGRSGQVEVQATAVENTYVGVLQWLEENSKEPDKIDFQKQFARELSYVTMSDAVIGDIAYKREKSTDIAFRANATFFDSIARESSVGNHKNLNVRGHQTKIRELMMVIDPTFFGKLLKPMATKEEGTERTKELLNHLSKYTALKDDISMIKNIDDIFERLDSIIKAIVYSYEPEKFKQIITAWGRKSRGEN